MNLAIDGNTIKGIEITELIIPDKIGGNVVTGIGVEAFRSLTSLKKITIPEGVIDIRCKAFMGCTGLIDVTIPKSVTYIGEKAFKGCTGLTRLLLPDVHGITIDCKAFYGCTGLPDVTRRRIAFINPSAIEDLDNYYAWSAYGDEPFRVDMAGRSGAPYLYETWDEAMSAITERRSKMLELANRIAINIAHLYGLGEDRSAAINEIMSDIAKNYITRPYRRLMELGEHFPATMVLVNMVATIREKTHADVVNGQTTTEWFLLELSVCIQKLTADNK